MTLAALITSAIDRFYIRPLRGLVPRTTFRYAACGGFTYLVFDPLCYAVVYNGIIAHRYFDLGFILLSPHIAAMLVVFPFTLLCGFWLNRNVAFHATEGRTRRQLIRYLLSIGGAVMLTYIGMKLFVEVCGIWPTPAKVITTLLTTVYSYLASRYFTFRRR